MSDVTDRFDEAIQALAPRRVLGTPPASLEELTDDSREVVAGGGFLAVRGAAADGHRFIEGVLEKGARVVVCEQLPDGLEARLEPGVCVIELDDTRRHLPALARAAYGEPSREMTVFGVTGTNGKTTTTHILESIGQRLGRRVGIVGTIAHRFPGFEVKAHNTTPGVLFLTRLMRRMRDAGVEWAALEVSSHGLVQGRLETTLFDAAIWTHLGLDHLDFHGTQAAYRDAKLRLFDARLPASLAAGKPAIAVVNADDATAREAFTERAATLGARLRWYGDGEGARWGAASGLRESPQGVAGQLRLGTWEGAFELPLIGHFNLQNALAAASAVTALGEHDGAAVASALAHVTAIPGRMEHLGGDGGRPHVLVDYAHTPDALALALEAARSHTRGALIAVFGAGGDRDPSKRPLMGHAAATLADRIVITNDNPRSESPAVIAEAILTGIPEARRDFTEVILDRRAAIQRALDSAGPDDMVVVAGKGHEDYQIIGAQRRSMDDRALVREALARWRPPRG